MSNRHSVPQNAAQDSGIITEEEPTEETSNEASLILRLKKPEEERPHVTWAEGTIDNEHLGRLKSNCCCIWVNPRAWDDPSTWEQDEHEVEHCRGHTLPPPPDEDKNSDPVDVN